MKYIAYCRKSTDEKDKQVLSLETQITELKEFATREHLDVVDYITESKTAKIPGRPKFEGILKRVEKGEVSGILSWHPDRLARNSVDGGRIIYLLDTGKLLDLKFPSFWFESTPQGKFMLGMAFNQSKYYVDNLSENVKRGNRQKLRNGVWPNRAPYGYFNEPKLRTIEIDPPKAGIVKKAFQLFAKENKSLADIARYMAKLGITKKNGQPIRINQVKFMLTSRFYIGILEFAGEYYPGSHQCFISKPLFDQVQKQMTRISRPRKDGHNFAFTGMIKCGECGASITAEEHTKFYKTTNHKATYVYYRCTKKIKPCSQPPIPEPELETQIRKIVMDASLPAAWGRNWLEWLNKDEEREKLFSGEQINKLELDSASLDKKSNLLLDGFLDQIISPQIYKQKKNEMFDQKLKIQEKISQIQTQGSSWIEPMREFINMAMDGEKTARAKNNCSDLAIGAKNTGSNFFLTRRRLSVNYKKGFATLWAEGGAQSACLQPNSKSLSVDDEGFEPPTSSV